MANDYFSFKQFTVWQDKTAMKVGTDGVLLGTMAVHAGPRLVLDIGTGTGLVALIAAQRFPKAVVHAIDIEPDAALQARDNFAASPFAARLTAHCAALDDWTPQCTYDLIVCNPPYFTESLLPPDSRRSLARHTLTLTFRSLAAGTARLLAPDGVAAFIVPADACSRLETEMTLCGLHTTGRVMVCTTPAKPPKRAVLHFARKAAPEVAAGRLCIELEGHRYSDEYRRLTADFYLR